MYVCGLKVGLGEIIWGLNVVRAVITCHALFLKSDWLVVFLFLLK